MSWNRLSMLLDNVKPWTNLEMQFVKDSQDHWQKGSFYSTTMPRHTEQKLHDYTIVDWKKWLSNFASSTSQSGSCTIWLSSLWTPEMLLCRTKFRRQRTYWLCEKMAAVFWCKFFSRMASISPNIVGEVSWKPWVLEWEMTEMFRCNTN